MLRAMAGITQKKQCSCTSIVVTSKTEWLGTKKRKRQKEYYGDFYCILGCSPIMRNLK